MATTSKPDWSVHPHECYSIMRRTIFAVLGSIIPLGCAAIGNGVLQKLDGGVEKVGLVFVVVGVVFVTAWRLGIVKTVRSEMKDLYDYAVLGSVYPANVFLMFFLIQGIK